jgi:catechol 2,3-dioxygenase-like lactoylglutathione lyase family enzyme
MRTLHVGLRVSNLDPSLAFYRAVGYTVTGTVEGTRPTSPSRRTPFARQPLIDAAMLLEHDG